MKQTAGAFEPATLNGLTLKNRVLKAATFEGRTPKGVPGERLRDFHTRIAEGGIAMTTLAYCATEADGRVMEHMMWLHEGIEKELRDIIDGVHAAGAKVSGQLSHCGHFSQNRRLQSSQPPKGPSRMFVAIGASVGRYIAPAMTQNDINEMIDGYRRGARFMKKIGFDAIEIHFGHGYALSQFISPKTNKRKDQYGGSHENRMRLPVEVLNAVREEVGAEFPILGKISMTDAVKGGVDYDLGVEVAKSLDDAGIDGLIPSAGTSSYNSMYMFRGDSVAEGMIASQNSKLVKVLLKLMAPIMWKSYPYEPTYLLEAAKRVKAAVSCPIIYIGGCSTRADLDKVFAEGFDFVQIGRSLLRDPDFVRNAQASGSYDSGCIHCNRCVPLINDPAGVRCVLNDPVSDATDTAAAGAA